MYGRSFAPPERLTQETGKSRRASSASLAFLQAVAAERRELQAAFDQPDRKTQRDEPFGNARRQLRLHGCVGIELREPVEFFRCEWFIHSRT